MSHYNETKKVLDKFRFPNLGGSNGIRWYDDGRTVCVHAKEGKWGTHRDDPNKWYKLGLDICAKIPNLKVKDYGSIYVELKYIF
jgi:hypothetical protein